MHLVNISLKRNLINTYACISLLHDHIYICVYVCMYVCTLVYSTLYMYYVTPVSDIHVYMYVSVFPDSSSEKYPHKPVITNGN